MSSTRESFALPPGSQLGHYRLEQAGGSWGFYLTYDAVDQRSGQAVAVHELVPEELVTRTLQGKLEPGSQDASHSMEWARDRFLREGRALQACPHSSIQKVLEVFEANDTAYWVTSRDEPRTFKSWLAELGRTPTEEELRGVLAPLLDGLHAVHAAGCHHLNIKPETIQMTGSSPRLSRFASARQAIARHSHGAAAATTGYSPPEQYDVEKAEGAWTDIYSLAAVMHRAITGQAPPEADQRLGSDPYERLTKRCAGGQHSGSFLRAIDAALAPDPVARPQTIQGWRRMLAMPAPGGSMKTPRRNPALAVVGVCVLALALWFIFRPKPVPMVVKDAATEEKQSEEDKKDKASEEEQKAEQEKLAAEKEAAQKVEQEKQAAEEAVRLAREAAEAAAKAEAARLAAEEAARKAVEESTTAQKLIAAKAAAEAEAKKAAAEQAARLEEEARRAAESAALARKLAQQQAAEKLARLEAAKRKEGGAPPPNPPTREKTNDELAREQAERRAAEKAAEEKRVADQMRAAERAAAAKAAAEKAAAEKAEAEKRAQAAGDPNKGKYQQSTSEGAETEENSKESRTTGSAGTGIPGVWETTATDAQGKPKRRLTIYDDGRYEISDNENWKDRGLILAISGRIQMKSDTTGAVVRSTFKLRSLSKIVTSGALGDEEWKRAGASPGKDPNPPKQ